MEETRKKSVGKGMLTEEFASEVAQLTKLSASDDAEGRNSLPVDGVGSVGSSTVASRDVASRRRAMA